ncbi:transporter [Actinomyces ruminicola]|uniref:ABC-2 type transport system permease protein n=1 Tax=Actinomyces ruminicola TaxID=332524 RepID=A0A1G9ZCH8_9ACTO|nr:transporter [Actinomyces ruminicola]SDN19160.1 ABC-2 type transport system permease protein [Actinomyces ruminicola]
MVATLVSLRWRITVNALRNNIWATIGLILGAAMAAGMLAPLLAGAVALGRADAVTITTVLGAVGAVLSIGWMVVPLLFTGADATLDPRVIAAWTAPSRALTVGLAVAGACGLPGVITGLVLLLPALTWAVAGQAGAAVLALVLAPAALSTCVLLGRSVVVGAGLSSSRRGRDLLAFVGFFAVMAISLLPSLLNSLLDMERLDFGGLLGIARVLGLTPLGWALAAPGYLAQGKAAMAVLLAVGALALPLVLLPLWHRVVVRVMTGPAHARGHSHARRAHEAGGVDDGAAQPDVLPWQRRLARVSSGPTAAVAARCLRYWRTDPRYLIQVAVIIMLSLLFTGMIATNYDTMTSTSGDVTTVTFTGVDLTPGRAPGALFMVGPIIALLCGWMVHDDLAFDSTALWTHMAAGLPGRSDRLGRVLAVVTWQLPLLTALILIAGWLTGNWAQAPAYFGATLGVYGVALAWSSLTSVLLPYETNPPGESPMKSRTSGTAIVAGILQTLGFFAVATVSAPVLVLLVVVVTNKAWPWGWLVLAGGMLWGGGVAWGGVVLGGRQLDQRYAQVLATIRSWPGHDAA